MFSGSYVALVTPFKQNSEVDFDAYGRLIDWQLEQGTDGIVPCGCTGEAATLSHSEQKQCIEFAMKRVDGRVPVVAGSGSNNTREAIELTQFAKDAGCQGVLVITPYYNKPMPEGQFQHYKAIAESVDIPIMLYNVPSRTGTNILPETVARMSTVKNIVSIKEAAGSVDQVSQIRSLCEINIMSGDDSLALPMISVGASGVVSVAANVVPNKIAGLCKAANDGDYVTARQLHYRVLPLLKALFVETNPIPVKAMLARMGMIENVLRLPLTPLSDASMAKIEPVLKDLDLIDA